MNETENRTWSYKALRFISTRQIPELAFLSMVLGVGYGLLANSLQTDAQTILIIQFPGKIFINMLKAVVMFFIIITMIRTPMDMKEVSEAKTLGSMSIIYYLSTSVLAAVVGLVFVNIIKPGTGNSLCKVAPGTFSNDAVTGLKTYTVVESLLSIGESAFPKNVVQAIATDNILGVLVCFLVFGFFMAAYRDTNGGRIMKSFLDVSYQVIVDIVYVIISFTPVGIFSLVAGNLANIKDYCIFLELLMFLVTFAVGLLFHSFVVYPLLFLIFVRENPFKHYIHFSSSILTAFATASSAAALPSNIEAARKAGVRESMINFVMPIGATLNMDGSCIYYTITILFVTNLLNQNLSIGYQIALAIVSSFVTAGSAPIPSGALVYLVAVANAVSVSIPQTTLSLLFAIDPLIMDRSLTSVNVTGDSYAVKIIQSINDRLKERKKKKGLDVSDSESDYSNDKPENSKKIPKVLSNSLLSTANKLRRQSLSILSSKNREKMSRQTDQMASVKHEEKPSTSKAGNENI